MMQLQKGFHTIMLQIRVTSDYSPDFQLASKPQPKRQWKRWFVWEYLTKKLLVNRISKIPMTIWEDFMLNWFRNMLEILIGCQTAMNGNWSDLFIKSKDSLDSDLSPKSGWDNYSPVRLVTLLCFWHFSVNYLTVNWVSRLLF